MSEKVEAGGRPDKRKQFLTVMAPDVIKNLKKAALDAGKPAYEIVEIAVLEWLAKKKSK